MNAIEQVRAKLQAAANALDSAAQALDELPEGEYAIHPAVVAIRLRGIVDNEIAEALAQLPDAPESEA